MSINKIYIISFLLILVMAVVLGTVFVMVSKQMARRSISQKLRDEVSRKGIMMEDYLQPEIALAKKLATSPTVIQFFKKPQSNENRSRAMTEFKSFQDAFTSHMIFWANDIDKEFWNAMEYSYTINPDNPTDYWYKMTLFETEVYNFNINYNAELNMTCLWLNAVVRNENQKPVGMVGTGIELDNFIGKCYEHLGDEIDMYFFNESKEVTGAKDKQVLVDKKLINKLYSDEADFDHVMRKSKELSKTGGGLYEFQVNQNTYGVIRYLPSYGWYLLATESIYDEKLRESSTLLIILIIAEVIFSIFVIFITKLQIMMSQIRLSQEKERENQTKEREMGMRLFQEAQNLAVSAKETAATSQDSSAAVKEIVATMEDTNDLSENISRKIKDVSSVASTTSSDVVEGVNQIELNVKQLHEIFAANQKTIEGMKNLSEKIESIWDIVSLINNVADQAKIIAFNAELEASSAGEAGKSFRIVANEIRRLSDGIIEGTREIKEKITEVQHSSDSLILASQSSTEKINEGYENARDLDKKFNNIKKSAEITAKSADDIADIIQQQATASEQILIAIKEIANGIENFTVATDNISGTAENVRKISEGLNNANQE
ncbi:methyl-accepting chemotaxis protein [Treponema zioleckii]|uniref:methyl-accepting chemotaxis protein n=1 Tax=Treponema zioleckii TaxID=331680 RepID=UPI00168A6243|nr:methyl-accepting chemotaxis protein [Treponema zioleckii]